jgi:uncharacterized membrane protein YbhN (UPF0104 family)
METERGRSVREYQGSAALAEAKPLWAAAALAAVLLTTAAKVARWRGILGTSDVLPYPSLARALLVGQVVNAVVPARAGDVARAYVLDSDEGIGKARVLGTVAAEKAFDVLFLLISAALTALLASLPPWLDASLAGTAATGGVVLSVGLAMPRSRLRAWAERLPGRMGRRLGVWVEQGLAGLAALRRPRMALTAGAWSALIWVLAAATNGFVFLAFGLSLPIAAALLVLTLLHVGTAPPSSPVRLGVFHALVVVGLEPFGVTRSAALACAAVLHLVVYGPQLLLGAAALACGRRGLA